RHGLRFHGHERLRPAHRRRGPRRRGRELPPGRGERNAGDVRGRSALHRPTRCRHPRNHLHRTGPAGRPLQRGHQTGHRENRLRGAGPALRRHRHQDPGGYPLGCIPQPRDRLVRARSRARKRAIDLLYEADTRALNRSNGEQPAHVDEIILEVLRERLEYPGHEVALPQYAVTIAEGVSAELGQIDEHLTTYSHGWTLPRMPVVDRAILRLGTW